MTHETRNGDSLEPPLALLQKQRSHVLFVLSNPEKGYESDFLQWYQGVYRNEVSRIAGVLNVRQYARHEVDITEGRYPAPAFQYLGVYEVSFDGAEAAGDLIERVTALHARHAAAQAPATWLYYPASEKVGRSPAVALSSMLVVAFANGLPGQEDEFREWYATRHIRHALNIPVLFSGQSFGRTKFQRPGAMEANFATIAMYEQVGTPEAFLESIVPLIPKGVFSFPTLDRSRFGECLYRPVQKNPIIFP